MEFLDFINKYKGIVFIWYGTDKKYSVTPENIYRITDFETSDLSDIVPFTLDIPANIISARFGGRNGTYCALGINNITTPRQNETVYDFLKRDV